MPAIRPLLALCVLPLLSGLVRGQEGQEVSLWLPKYLVSAKILSMTGSDHAYVPAYQGDELRGFDLKHGAVHYFRPTLPQTKIATRITAGPLELQRVIRLPASREIQGIELQSESIHKTSTATTPDRADLVGQVVELRQRTQVSIISKGGQGQGEMWIVHSDDTFGGMQFVIHLECTLRPEFFPEMK